MFISPLETVVCVGRTYAAQCRKSITNPGNEALPAGCATPDYIHPAQSVVITRAITRPRPVVP